MDKQRAMEEAVQLYEGEFGNLRIIAGKLSMRTTLTVSTAERLMRSTVVEYIADLLVDYGEDE